MSDTPSQGPIPAGPSDFAARLIAWQRRHGRHDLPWQGADPYGIWVSEIMLQQTQVETVIPYYRRFLQRFPDVASLAAASPDEVLALWSGLGYYSRARHLHAAARRIVKDYAGRFPERLADIQDLPGVGRSTAAAVLALALGGRAAILDGNVKRVLCRAFGIEGWPGKRQVEERLWRLAESLLPESDMATYTQGLMDLGALVCRRARPACERCPFESDCVARRSGREAKLPAPRPNKALPERATTMLILLDRGEILLEKRPAVGLWGGLWSLPECSAQADALACARRLGYEAELGPVLPAVRHAFSHFRLRITPQALRVRHRALGVEAPGRLWLPLSEAVEAALPAPVRRILQTIEAGS